MKLFGQIVRTVVNVAALPITAAVDFVAFAADAGDGDMPGRRTKKRLEQLKREAQEDE